MCSVKTFPLLGLFSSRRKYITKLNLKNEISLTYPSGIILTEPAIQNWLYLKDESMIDTEKSSIFLIRKQDYRVTQWKNKSGQSLEIAIFPPQASLNENTFLWRLSSAQLIENGPFSEFPGYNRYLALINGKTLQLTFPLGHPSVTLKNCDVHHFSGDIRVSYHLIAPPISDLNLIYKRDKVKAHFKIIHLSMKPRSFYLEGKVALLFGVLGSTNATFYPGEQKFVIKTFETLLINLPKETNPCRKNKEEGLILLEPKSPGSLALIELDWTS